jgi:hypothetical protein
VDDGLSHHFKGNSIERARMMKALGAEIEKIAKGKYV